MEPELISVSSKGQLVLPVDLREELHIEKGTKMVIVVQQGMVVMKPIRKLSALRGVLAEVKKPASEIVAELRKEWELDLN